MKNLEQILIFIANHQKEIIYMIYFGMILVTLNTIYLLYKILMQKAIIILMSVISTNKKSKKKIYSNCRGKKC